ncbi:alpha amylase, catalytic region [Shewanella denitrificans OS217]|jgi:alpha-amylase|uniref:Alpha amylase, catalytic region n=1 Tax=Shewanella denitrificans (strain OS217 / ATCC BAA-1090 / DSM 15013) TaxID=318161 RepID=Q12N92_SHEDO|nr:alpha-amylase [Shewanella denitrificans]ABE55084.1 alpha amylase, catalytic region [Shewanella denitrificans OS217]
MAASNTKIIIKKRTSFRLTFALVAGLSALGLSSSASSAENGVMMQYFHWYTPADGKLWTQVQQESSALAAAGFTALWLPPAYKGASGALDVGYGVYDMYDLGEFNQKGAVRTKYGTKSQYVSAINTAHTQGLQVYGDLVFNHRGGADATESVTAVRVARDNRDREFGADVQIDAWTRFDFTARQNQHSAFKWRWYHFDGVDWAQNLTESNIFKFRGTGKGWDWEVDTENVNYDYLMYADLDFNHPEVVQELKDWGDWYLSQTQVDGFRLDAIKHIRYEFFNDWLDYMRANSGKTLFTVGEFWSYDTAKLHNYINKTSGRMSLFDAPLHLNFHQASTANGNYDMRRIWDNSLMKEQPNLAVTLVENHDTQACQALASPVNDWFKPLAYAFILLRSQGYPNVFYADYYGANYTSSDNSCNNSVITMVSHKTKIDQLLKARKDYAYGPQIDYLDHWDIIGWTRLGDTSHPKAMAVIMSDGASGTKWMNVNRTSTRFMDITGHRSETVTTNADGWGQFPVNGGSYSVWVEQATSTSTVAVTFNCNNGVTYAGQDVYVVGNQANLGNWNTAAAIKLSPTGYPSWSGTINLPMSKAIEWKCIKKSATEVVWQGGGNNTYTTPSSGVGSTSASF